MVCIECKTPSLYHVAEVSDRSESCEKLSVKWWPELLVWEQLCREKRKGLPSFWSPLLEDGANGLFGCVGGDGDWGVRARMAEHDGGSEGLFDRDERIVHFSCPQKVFGLPFQRIKKVKEMLCGLGDEAAIVVKHSQEPL